MLVWASIYFYNLSHVHDVSTAERRTLQMSLAVLQNVKMYLLQLQGFLEKK